MTKEMCDQTYCDLLMYMVRSTDNNPKCGQVGQNFCGIAQSYNLTPEQLGQNKNATLLPEAEPTEAESPYI
ncbi:unnamed protein product, partial [Mesorhabditis spiculigera]